MHENKPKTTSATGLPVFINGIPVAGMTDRKWQQIFAEMRANTQPSQHRRLSERPREHIVYDEFGNKQNEGYTVWQTYCTFINDVLQQIRSGAVDYCYYAYQIRDLLTFEHARLQTKYHPQGQYWVVWLEEKL